MFTISSLWFRCLLLTLTCLGLLGIISLGIRMSKHDPEPTYLILRSRTFVFGEPFPFLSPSTINQLLVSLFDNHLQEKNAMNLVFVKKGLLAQAYQQSPFAIALVAQQSTANNLREHLMNVALKLTPKNHPLHTILTQLKFQ